MVVSVIDSTRCQPDNSALMDVPLFLQGALIGFAIAAPVGPIGVLCIRRSLAEGRIYGLLSGLGAATADAVYGAIAAFGLTIISSFLVEQQIWLRLLGGIFLLYLGIRTYFAKSETGEVPARSETKLGAYATTFFLTLTNPLTILSLPFTPLQSFSTLVPLLKFPNYFGHVPATASLVVLSPTTSFQHWVATFLKR